MDTVPDPIYFKTPRRFVRAKALADRFGLDDPADALGKWSPTSS
jgi:hypothetical protein